MFSYFGKSKEPEKVKKQEVKEPDVPADTLGIHILNPARAGDGRIQYDVDIVAVHGLGGDAFKTWTADNKKMWLRDFLPEDLQNPRHEYTPCLARAMTFGYNVSVYSAAASERASTFADALLSALHDSRPGSSKNRPIIFVGHSLGGIVIKKALLQSRNKPAYSSILTSTCHLMFFGTPHQGTSSGANLVRSAGAFLTGASEGSVLREMDVWSVWTTDTNSAFVGIADGFTITTFWEKYDLHGVKVVHEGSATLYKANEFVIGLDANHKNMCKFSGRNSLYLVVLGRLSTEIAAIRTPVADSAPVVDEERMLRVEDLFGSFTSGTDAILSNQNSRMAENRQSGTNAWSPDRQIFRG